jgi:hypothetical protein
MLAAVRVFWTSELGAASTRKGFFAAAALGVVMMSAYLMANGGQAPERPTGPTADEVVLARLTSGQVQTFDPRTVERRLAMFTDRTEFTDAQLRNAHRTWSRRAADRSYRQRDLAADMVVITEAAMELRGIRPHSDI